MFGMNKKRGNDFEEEYLYDEYETREYPYEQDYDDYEEIDEYAYPNNRHLGEETQSHQKTRTPQEYREEFIQEPSVGRNSLEKENQDLLQEVLRLEDTVSHLNEQLSIKQEEASRMANLLTEKEEEKETVIQKRSQENQELREKIAQLEDQLNQQKNDLSSIHDDYAKKIAELKEKYRHLEGEFKEHEKMKSQLANIVIETKEQGRTIVERAQWEAKQIKERAQIDAHAVMADAALELRVVNQEAAQYKEKLTSFREESLHLMDKLIASSEHIANLDHFKQINP